MQNKLLLGPLLGLENGNYYTVVFVTAHSSTAQGAKGTEGAQLTKAEVLFNGVAVAATKIGALYSGDVWRAEIQLPSLAEPQYIQYQIQCDGVHFCSQQQRSSWAFYVPAQNEKPKFAYASCNGFSDLKLMNTTAEPYRLWQDMAALHSNSAQPFSLLLLGGDQLYADSIWTEIKPLQQWNALGLQDKIKRQASAELKKRIQRFYSELYLARWNQPQVADMLASIPSLMMWDDHDIFDGWGSYPQALTDCAVYQAIFAAAKQHFELLQIRGRQNRCLLAKPDAAGVLKHYAMHLQFQSYHILALDNRSERSLTQVMSDSQWQDVALALKQCTTGDLLLMTAVPVVYRDFASAENVVDATPWEEEVTDDLKDHWRAKEHQGERQKLMMRLLDNARVRNAKTVLLSGDVHVGCLGVIRDKRDGKLLNMHQVVSSGIVHPAPTYIQWLGILAITNDNTEYLDENKSISADMLKPYGANQYIRARNFVTLQEGTDHKLWVNWIIEGKDKPAYPLSAQ